MEMFFFSFSETNWLLGEEGQAVLKRRSMVWWFGEMKLCFYENLMNKEIHVIGKAIRWFRFYVNCWRAKFIVSSRNRWLVVCLWIMVFLLKKIIHVFFKFIMDSIRCNKYLSLVDCHLVQDNDWQYEKSCTSSHEILSNT